MIKSAVTISLVPETYSGPFVFHHDLADGCRKAADLGFDAVEVFPPSAAFLIDSGLSTLLKEYGLKLAAVGTGAGWVKHQWTLTSPDAAVRGRSREFVAAIISAASRMGAPAIIGSMQGRDAVGHHLREALEGLGEWAAEHGVPLLYEPLNRYETSACNRLEDGSRIVGALPNVKLLADLFHMNIEESDMPASLRAAGALVGHVHFADSNRGPVGTGHTDLGPIAAALRDIGYDGYVSAECLPHPDGDAAAELTIKSFRRYFR